MTLDACVRVPGVKQTAVVGLAAAWLLVAGCNSDPAPDRETTPDFPTAASLGAQMPESVASYLASEPYASADRDLGDRLLMQCRACHTIEKGATHSLGPNLFGVFGREAGAVGSYGYTVALREANFVWTPRALNAWLAMPSRFLPGNAMAFGGLRYESDRAALIASLLRQSSEGSER